MNNELGYEFHFFEKVLYLEFSNIIDMTTVREAIDEVRRTFPSTEFDIVSHKGNLGYWSAWDYKNSKSIYCGTRSLASTREQINKYREDDKSREVCND